MANNIVKETARIIKADELKQIRYPLPDSWKNAIGLLKGRKINALRYQKKIREEWEKRLKRQISLAKHGH